MARCLLFIHSSVLSQALGQALVPEYSRMNSVSSSISESNKDIDMVISPYITHCVSTMTDECPEGLPASELDWGLRLPGLSFEMNFEG